MCFLLLSPGELLCTVAGAGAATTLQSWTCPQGAHSLRKEKGRCTHSNAMQGTVTTVGAVRKVGGADCFPREQLHDTTYGGAQLAQDLAHHRDSLSAGQVDGQEGTDDEGERVAVSCLQSGWMARVNGVMERGETWMEGWTGGWVGEWVRGVVGWMGRNGCVGDRTE